MANSSFFTGSGVSTEYINDLDTITEEAKAHRDAAAASAAEAATDAAAINADINTAVSSASAAQLSAAAASNSAADTIGREVAAEASAVSSEASSVSSASSATAAEAYKDTAVASAIGATASEIAAGTSASLASTKASDASTSEANAATSASNAAASETGAAAQATTAITKASEATTSADNSAASAASAASSVVSAAANEAAAASSATASETSATASATSATQSAVCAASAAADALATAADLLLIDDATAATSADRVQTGLDATATAADRVQTGLNAAATAVSAADATAAASLVNGVVTPFNSEILWPVSLTTLPSGWYDTTQRLLSGTAARAILSNNPLFVYVESDLLPELVLDFAGSSYFVDGTASTLSAATTHVATTNATMTDSDGLIKWRPHNLLTYSEQFDNAAWFKLGSTSLLPNTDVAPDGTTTADELNVVLSTSVIGQDIFGIGVLDRTFSVWVKAPAVGAATAVRLSSNDRISWDTGLSAKVVLTTEWQLVSVSGTLSSGSDVRVNIGGKDETGTGDPDCVGKVLVWGAHLYRSDLGGMVDNPETGDSYVRTADRPIGPELVTNGTFDTDTDWTLVGAGSSITGGEFVGPASGAQGVQQNSPTPLGTNLYRVQFDAYVGSSVSTVYLRLGSNSNAASWTVSTTPNTFSGVVRAGGTNDLIYLLVGGATNLHLDNISVKKVDVNPAIARYMPRTGNHVYNGTSWVNEGLLFESEARTNSLTYSQDFTNAAWSISNSTNNATLVDSKFIPNSGVTGSYFMKSTTVVTGQVYTFTFRVKAAGFNFVELSGDAQSGRLGGRVVFDLLLGTVALEEGGGVGKIVDVGGGVYDCSLTTTAATSTNAWPFMRPRVNATTSATGDGVSGIQLYHAQLEAGSTPSSYIPTTTSATVTRAAETLTVAAADMPWPTPVEVTGTELVTNGTFDTDVTGWVNFNTGVITQVSGEGSISTSTTFDGAYQVVSPTLTSKLVLCSGNVSSITGGTWSVNLKTSSDGTGSPLTDGTINLSSTGAFSFVAWTTSPINSLSIQIATGVVETLVVDNISLKEINPLSVSIQMDGQMTYADTDLSREVQWYTWEYNTSNFIDVRMSTVGTRTGQPNFYHRSTASGQDIVGGGNDYFSPDINVPFNLAARHGSTFINGATDGTALTADLTPTALPDLSATDFRIGSTFMGNIGRLRVWADDISNTGIAEAST